MLREYLELRKPLVTVLLGPPQAMLDLPHDHRPNARVAAILRSLPKTPGEMRRLRTYLARAGVTPGTAHYGQDRDLIAHAVRSLESGRLRALVLENTSVASAPKSSASGARAPAVKSPLDQTPGKLPGVNLPRSGASTPATPASRPPGLRLNIGPDNDVTPVPRPKPFAQWTTEERIAELVRLTRKRVPADVGAALDDLLTAENLTITAGVVAVAAAAQLTPYGWIADAALAGAAFVMGGLAAVAALKNLADAIILTANARNERDLDASAEELSAAVIAMGAAAIAALLRRVAGRDVKGSGGAAETSGAAKAAPKSSAPYQAPKQATKTEPQAVKPAPKPVTLDDMMKKAPQAKDEIDKFAKGIADKYGGNVATAPIKSAERAAEKIAKDYGGDASQIKDLARNTIVVDESRIAEVEAELRKAGAIVKQAKADTNPLGYSGINSFMKTESGIFGEIQVNSPEMIYAKEKEAVARAILGDSRYDAIAQKVGVPGGQGHTFYEQWRSLPPGDAGRAAIEAESKAYHNAIRAAK